MSSPFIPGSHVPSFQLWRSVSCCSPEVMGRSCSQQVVGHPANHTQWEWGSWEQAAPSQLRPELHGALLLLSAAGENPGFDLLPCCLAGKGSPWNNGKMRAACYVSGYLSGVHCCLAVWHMFDISGGAAASVGWCSILKCQLNWEDDSLLLLAAVLAEVVRTT